MTNTEMKVSPTPEKHWLQRPENIRKLWWIFGAILALTVVAQAAVEVHAHFGIDGAFGFSAFYGFFTCVAMVIAAKILGWWLKRYDNYYPEETLKVWTAPLAHPAEFPGGANGVAREEGASREEKEGHHG